MEEWLWLKLKRFILLSWHMYEDFRTGFNIQHNLYQNKSNTTIIYLVDLSPKKAKVEIVVDIRKWGNFIIYYFYFLNRLIFQSK